MLRKVDAEARAEVHASIPQLTTMAYVQGQADMRERAARYCEQEDEKAGWDYEGYEDWAKAIRALPLDAEDKT